MPSDDPAAVPGAAGTRNPLRAALLGVIWLYRKLVSPLTPARCCYYPTCSEYAAQAIQRYGILRGLVLAAWRLLRCNPWSSGGVDLVEDQRLFKVSRRPANV